MIVIEVVSIEPRTANESQDTDVRSCRFGWLEMATASRLEFVQEALIYAFDYYSSRITSQIPCVA
jgi:hypothetical protein